MRHLATIILVLIIGSCYGQSNSKIEKIRKIYHTVNDSTSYFSKRSKDFYGKSSEGGEIELFSLNQNIKKAIIYYYGEMGKRTKEYYFKDNSLCFVFDVYFNYDRPISQGNISIKSKEENRYYIWNGDIIKYIDPKGRTFLDEQIPNEKRKWQVIDYEQTEIKKILKSELSGANFK